LTVAILCLVFALWPVASLVGGQAFAVLVGLGALMTAAVSIRHLRPRLYMLALLAFFAFAGASVLWSPRPVALVEFDLEAMKISVRSEVIRVGLLLVAGGALLAVAQALDANARKRISQVATVALLAQLVIVVLLTLFEREAIAFFYPGRPDDEGVQNISRNCLIMAAAAPFLIAGLTQGKRRGIAISITVIVLAVEVAVLLKREVYAGLLALGFAGAGWVIVQLAPKRGFQIIGSLAALAILSTPVWSWAASRGADATSAASTIDYRQLIWERTLEVVAEKPVTGGGVGVLRTMRDTFESGGFSSQLVIPNHPHNMALQLWAETGAIGAALLATLLLLAGFRLPVPSALGAAGPRTAMLVGVMGAVGCVSFDLWNEWWWGVGALLAVLVIVTPRSPQVAKPVARGITFGDDRQAFDGEPIRPAQPANAEPSPHEPSDRRVAPEQPSSTHNNFHLVRLLLALMVVAYHGVALSGLSGWSDVEARLSLAAELGVQGFFAVSGYLVWISLERSSSLGRYAEKRVRRLLPAYVVIVLACALTALILSPASRDDLPGVLRYVGWNLGLLNFMEPNLPGVFVDNRFTEVNGALWTLKIEVMFYLVLPVLAWLLRAAGRHRWILVVAVYVASEAWRVALEQTGSAQNNGLLIELSRQLPGQMSFFIVGIALAAWRNDLNWRSALAPVALIVLAASILVPALDVVRALGIGVVVIWIATGLPRIFDAARFGDLSYGLYIVHFPIIQTVVALGLFLATPWVGVATAATASVFAAFLVWHLVEKPSLRADSAYRLAG
jgi:peptidoglycan/LPS O-acetylase OafA/YrhL/O-antigen ligase